MNAVIVEVRPSYEDETKPLFRFVRALNITYQQACEWLGVDSGSLHYVYVEDKEVSALIRHERSVYELDSY